MEITITIDIDLDAEQRQWFNNDEDFISDELSDCIRQLNCKNPYPLQETRGKSYSEASKFKIEVK